MNNPLLTSFLLPPFSIIRSEHIVPAIKNAIEHCRCTVETVVAQSEPFTWDNLCQKLAEADDFLKRIWSPINHLNAVKNSQDLRDAYKKSLQLISEYSTWVSQNNDLYRAYYNLRHGQYYAQLNVAQKKVVNNALRDFKLSGIALPQEKKKRYGQIIARLSELGSIYSNNVLDATMHWSKLIVDKKMLTGMPESALSIAHIQAQSRKKKGWLLTLDHPNYLTVLTYCDNASLREEIYYAYNTRASDQGPYAGKWDNEPIMKEMLALRHELAQLLHFSSYAEKSLATKMAQSSQHVLNFLNNLVTFIRPYGEKELSQLRAFVQHHFKNNNLNPWDIAYYSEKQRQYQFSINDEQLRCYFPEQQVLSGLFKIVNFIYGIVIKERFDIDTWHPDVRFFDLFNEHGEQISSFYLDLYIRHNKRGGAWMDDCISRMRKSNGELQKPVAYLTCNFNRPINGKPALFTHNEVITLFHEFGHGLHHMLTCIDTPGVSGIDGVPWDAVELPSQFMENYCWKLEALAYISSHYKTGEPLPNILLNNLLKIRTYQIALFILRQLELSLFDFKVHAEYQPEKGARILDIVSEINKHVSILPKVDYGRFPHTFSHIFSGGYDAGYYSYLWANVLAADAWSYFDKTGIFNRKSGKLFLDSILSRGGAEDPIVLFTRFRGRQPQLKAMLHHYGFQEEYENKFKFFFEQ